MFAKSQFVISDIFEGLMPSALFGAKGQYLAAIGIDPDMPATDQASDLKMSGMIRPVNYEAFSGELITAAPIGIITNPKDSYIRAILADGNVVRYNPDLSGETVEFTLAAAAARGSFYNNNYIYIPTPTDIARIGPLDGTPSLDDTFWTGTLGLTDLTDASFPQTLFGLGYLNHFGMSHVDGAGYILDYLNGQGMVHLLNTEFGTHEGDNDSSIRPSAYNILQLPFNYIPITVCKYGEDLVVACAFTTDSGIIQGPGALFFFTPGTTPPSFYRKLDLPDVLPSVLWYVDGTLYGLSGDIAGGYRLFRYVGGDNIQTLAIVEDGIPPLQSANACVGSRLVWGANTTYPMVSSGLMGYGSKSDLLPRGAHHIAVSGFNTVP